MPLGVTYQMVKDAVSAAKTKAEELKNQPLLDSILKLQALAFELQSENEALHRERDQRTSLSFRNGLYWSDDPKNPGPFCPTCWGKDQRLVPIQTTGTQHRYCYACKTTVRSEPLPEQDDDFPPPREPIR